MSWLKAIFHNKPLPFFDTELLPWRDQPAGCLFFDLVLDEKNSLESRKAVAFLDHQEQNTEEIFENYFTAFKNINNGLQIAFISADKIGDFIKRFVKKYEDMLQLSEKAIREAEQRAKDSEEYILRLLMSEEMSKELAMYCIEHCQEKLPFFIEEEGKFYLADIDFLLRFWKRDAYFAQPAFSFIGQQWIK